ncbi:ABC-ATPase domain-containing protein [Fonticella tunisiensis]|uniref:Putative ABC-class ATPase n=1 Tax=Fonticella tunisiensis TaxID=1096341 RepID=A0A4R7KC24_9CLOT|nr:ABC-ATPase domain-containing protein [Fonticella tunisiensis]TDT51341.1 putative ABC-class ATPase [Fonticella tunisiensis]
MNRLRNKLVEIDRKGYKAYKEITGTYKGDDYLLHIDYVQPDPFANPSRIRVELPKDVTKYKEEWYNLKHRRIAFEDFLTRQMVIKLKGFKQDRSGTGKSGLIFIDRPGQEVLERTSVKVGSKGVEVRLSIGLPASGRTILGSNAEELLCRVIPSLVKDALLKFDERLLMKHLVLSDNQNAIRNFLRDNNYVCFIGNDSILPRESGISDLPLKNGRAVPFHSPSSLEIEIPLPDGSSIKGMGIPEGVTLIVGGGYHGKSTLLNAIERGVYNHIPGDGREYVITNDTAFKIRAEDGRRIEKVNISPFINNLPFEKDTTRFSTEDASGSTSQAANIIEALEAGCKVLLIDEDTSATNFMIRDARMQQLVSKDKEPITPFIDRVRQLYEEHKVSTILVIGGSGDYFDVADNVIMMDEYIPFDVTLKAKEISNSIKNMRKSQIDDNFNYITPRYIKKQGLNPLADKKEKVDTKGLHTIIYGTGIINLSFVEQLVDESQTRSIAYMIRYIYNKLLKDSAPLHDVIDMLYRDIDEKGLDIISPYFGKHPGDLALPRKLELSAAINRMRSLQVK